MDNAASGTSRINTSRWLAMGLLLSPFLPRAVAEDIELPYATLFAGIHSLRCTAEAYGRAGTKDSPEPRPMRKIADIQYALKGNSIYFDYLQHNEKGDLTWSQLYTFDGVRSMDFFRLDQNLNIYPKKVACGAMEGFNVMIAPFAFAYGERITPRSGFTLTLAELADPGEWKRVAKIVKHLKDETVNGKVCKVIEAQGGQFADPAKGAFTMRAWLDSTNDDYPIRWQRILTNGAVAEEYSIVELGYLDDAKKIPYPKVAEYKSFNVAGVLTGRHRIVPGNIELNGAIDDRLFTIDPSLAAHVWDAATNKYIK